jgi:hypothetical protein
VVHDQVLDCTFGHMALLVGGHGERLILLATLVARVEAMNEPVRLPFREGMRRLEGVSAAPAGC